MHLLPQITRRYISIFCLSLIMTLAIATPCFADDNSSATATPTVQLKPPVLQIPIPNLPSFSNVATASGGTVSIPWIAQYIIAIYQYLIIIGSVIAVVVMMIGGIMYLTAGGLPDNVKRANGLMMAAISGLVVLLCSYFMLKIINPSLTQLPAIEISSVPEVVLEDDAPPDAPPSQPATPLPGFSCSASNIVASAQQMASLQTCLGGNHCAWTVSRILSMAGCNQQWLDNYVPRLFSKLDESGQWDSVTRDQAQAGDVARFGRGHTEIYMGNGYCIGATHLGGAAVAIRNNAGPNCTTGTRNTDCIACEKIPGEGPSTSRWGGGNQSVVYHPCSQSGRMTAWYHKK